MNKPWCKHEDPSVVITAVLAIGCLFAYHVFAWFVGKLNWGWN